MHEKRSLKGSQGLAVSPLCYFVPVNDNRLKLFHAFRMAMHRWILRLNKLMIVNNPKRVPCILNGFTVKLKVII